jgi:hypothetical protein
MKAVELGGPDGGPVRLEDATIGMEAARRIAFALAKGMDLADEIAEREPAALPAPEKEDGS